MLVYLNYIFQKWCSFNDIYEILILEDQVLENFTSQGWNGC